MKRSIGDEKILEAALTVFAEQGYDGATTRALAQAARINEVTLFRRFGNKENLLLAAVQQEIGKLGADEVVYTGDLEADLTQIVAFYQHVLAEQRGVVMLLLNEMSRHPELLNMLQVAMENAHRLAAIIGRYQAEGMLAGESPLPALLGLISPVFMSQILGISALGLLKSEPDEVVRQYLYGHMRRGKISAEQGLTADTLAGHS